MPVIPGSKVGPGRKERHRLGSVARVRRESIPQPQRSEPTWRVAFRRRMFILILCHKTKRVTRSRRSEPEQILAPPPFPV